MRSVMIGLFALAASAAAAQTAPQPDVIVVTGAAVVRRPPDVAFVTLAVETSTKSPRDAQRQNNDVMTAVLKRLADAGVARDALRTVGVRLDQEFDTANGKHVLRGFIARNVMEVTVGDVARAGEIADAAVQAGATSLDGIRFDIKDRSGAEREATRQAVADARGRAEAAAAGAGRAVDRILKIEQDGGGVAPPRPMMRMAAEAVVVETGFIDVRADVTLTVSMK
jgi:uncharacterized protein YggE